MSDSQAPLTSAPKWVVLQLTEKCNLRCSMCYEWGQSGSYHRQDHSVQLELATALKVIRELTPYRPYWGLFGGEPLLYPWLADILHEIQSAGGGLDIPTNGLLLEEHAELLVQTEPRRLWISLDGPPEVNDRQRGAGVFGRVTAGMQKLFETRKRLGRSFPKIGVTFLVTPFNYRYLESFFFEFLDLPLIDHISVEFQNWTTAAQCQEYDRLLREEFGITKGPEPVTAHIVSGIIQDPAVFRAMDLTELARQVGKVKEYCEQHGIYFIAYPKTIDPGNYRALFTGNWQAMADWRSRCTFPWIYTEINARGGVTSCHTFYDLTLGNVYEQGILEIWRGPAYQKYRNYLRKNLFPICTGCARYYSDPSKK